MSGFIPGLEFKILSVVTHDLFNEDRQPLLMGEEFSAALYPNVPLSLDTTYDNMFPSMILEVGFSESYCELKLDAKQWLLHSNREVCVVVLIKFT